MPVYEREKTEIKVGNHAFHIPFLTKPGKRLVEKFPIVVDEHDDPYYDSHGTYVKLAEGNGEETVEVGFFCGVMNRDVSFITGEEINKNSIARRKVIWKSE